MSSGIHHIEKSPASIEDTAKNDDFMQAATEAATTEHTMTVREAMQRYPKAILYSVGLSLAVVMDGYDMSLMQNFFSVVQFRHKYGHSLTNGDYQLSSTWQSVLSGISSVGAFFGLFLAGQLVEYFGFRRTMQVALVFISMAIFIVFFAQNLAMLAAGQLICGLPWGMFQGMASVYSADVAPLSLRSLLTSYINLCWAFGGFVSVGVLTACLQRTDEWAYRIPFAVQWIWILPIAAIVYFAPESPWWLLRQNRPDDARKTLRRLASSKVSDKEVESSLKLIQLTNEHERLLQAGTGYMSLFKGTNLRRTEIATITWVCQVTCGTWFASQITYFLQQGGLDEQDSFSFGLGMTALNCLGTIISWFVAIRLGRRKLYLLGLLGMLLSEVIVGCFGIPNVAGLGLVWASGAVLIANNLIYYLTIGPVCFTIISEIPSARLRNRTITFARACYLAAAVGAHFLQAALVNPTAWNLKGRGAFVWAGFCLVSLVWAFFRLPETKDRLAAELDILFEKRTRTRKFKTATVDLRQLLATKTEEN
ncbi:hypothetical protein PFICI_10812 [Pestalotiopsis fici W106-1]|uniref:Major facilitator superfamily (MFS) profile domain-containing protein n=1 Tax=Pestalotiopsis fici (strain W106-1 / CGMCC3.15140) TaxID=1229662 RepID=W3WSU1_PESFW|nr:uncharacterized protein PFICI_10812 [Pestalotiopsis fici W106-1]ETS76938.1 hypothetical protein PFICI_10812 [Pestalotiopsis fici W106-1]